MKFRIIKKGNIYKVQKKWLWMWEEARSTYNWVPWFNSEKEARDAIKQYIEDQKTTIIKVNLNDEK